jgi:ribosomal protein S18 acetylase RimI-like enzyme
VDAFSVLDNPIWSALTTAHRDMARSAGLARRYPGDVSPLAGLREVTPAALADLRALVRPGEGAAAVFTTEPLEVPGEWEVVRAHPLEQMVCTDLVGTPVEPQFRLQQADVPDMLALTAATEPGPFLPRTIEMGRYFGTRSGDGRLIAMAGERLRLDGFTEISAVCTDPQFRGRGHARALLVYLAARILAEGRTPFLHVVPENGGAKSLYERVGFTVRRTNQLTVITRR